MTTHRNASASQVPTEVPTEMPTEKPTVKPTNPLSEVAAMAAAILGDSDIDFLRETQPFDQTRPNRCNCKDNLEEPLDCPVCKAEDGWVVLGPDDGYDTDPEL